jgi:ketosteroid isomerase-like protein
MTDRQAILAAVENHYAMRNTEDPAKVLATIHPDCCHRIVGTDSLAPFTQLNRGDEETLRKAVDSLVGDWDLSGLQNLNIYIDEQQNTAVIQRKGTVLHKATGIKFDTELVDKLTFKDGRIVEYDQFLDTYHVAKEMGMIA